MDKVICSTCGKEYSKKGIATHIWRNHGEGKNHDPNKNRVAWNKGLSKEDNIMLGRSKDSRMKQSKTRVEKSIKHDESSKSKISASMKKAHKEGRAHNIGQSRWNNEPSYPEQFFMKVIDNEFSDKNYVREYSISRYSIDFAWVEKKLAIEIDGQQHEKIDYKARDKRKDSYLEQQGWKILRIKWEDMFHNPKEFIKIAINFIGE